MLTRYESIEVGKKWHLKNGTVVEDRMKALVESSSFEHPVHSMILEFDDPVKAKYFTDEELKELKSNGVKPLQ